MGEHGDIEANGLNSTPPRRRIAGVGGRFDRVVTARPCSPSSTARFSGAGRAAIGTDKARRMECLCCACGEMMTTTGAEAGLDDDKAVHTEELEDDAVDVDAEDEDDAWKKEGEDAEEADDGEEENGDDKVLRGVLLILLKLVVDFEGLELHSLLLVISSWLWMSRILLSVVVGGGAAGVAVDFMSFAMPPVSSELPRSIS